MPEEVYVCSVCGQHGSTPEDIPCYEHHGQDIVPRVDAQDLRREPPPHLSLADAHRTLGKTGGRP